MKAAFFLGKESMEVREVERPVAKKGEVLLKVKACAICGTDMRIYGHGHRWINPPHILGHEIAGVIEEIGEEVQGFKLGERVTVVTSIGCGQCRSCKEGRVNLCAEVKAIGYHYQGGFAQYILIPQEAVKQGNLLSLPQDLSFAEAALIEPLSCCINGQEYLNIGKEDAVLILGAGPVGCMHVELAKAAGAKKVILADISSSRLELVREFKADLFIDSSREDLQKRIQGETAGQGADVIIVACPSPEAQEQAFSLIGRRGRISFFGGLPKGKTITLDSNLIHYQEISVFGSFASFAAQYKKALSLITSKKIEGKKFITSCFPLEEIVPALKQARSGKALKMIITP